MWSLLPTSLHVLLLASVVIWLVLESRQARMQRPEAKSADRGSRPFLGIAFLIGIVAAFGVREGVGSTAIGPEVLMAWIGLALLWSGAALRSWSFRTLGRYFTFTVQTSADQPVISSGPYRVIRHPSYLGLLLCTVGIGLTIGNWLSLAILTVVIAAGLIYRIAVEERALEAELAERYLAYAKSRKRLIPFVW